MHLLMPTNKLNDNSHLKILEEPVEIKPIKEIAGRKSLAVTSRKPF